jgi:hypothetical protein
VACNEVRIPTPNKRLMLEWQAAAVEIVSRECLAVARVARWAIHGPIVPAPKERTVRAAIQNGKLAKGGVSDWLPKHNKYEGKTVDGRGGRR